MTWLLTWLNVSVATLNAMLQLLVTHTHTHTHTYIYIYIDLIITRTLHSLSFRCVLQNYMA